MFDKKTRWSAILLVATVAIGFAIRMLTGLARWGEMGHDEMLYSFAGRALFKGDGLIFPHGGPLISFHPLSAIFIGIFNLFLRNLETSSDLLFAFSGSMCAVPVYLLGRDIYGKNTGMVAAAITATLPFLATGIVNQDFTNTASLTLFLVFMGVWCCYRAKTTGVLGYSFGAGIFFSLAYLARPEGLLWMPIMIIWFVIGTVKDRSSYKKAIVSIGIMLLTFHLVALPYFFWLHQKTGTWQISAKAGSDVLESNWPDSAMPQIGQWESEHSNKPLYQHSLIHFFADNPRLLIVKLNRNLPTYLSSTAIVLRKWLIIVVLLHFAELLYRRFSPRRGIEPVRITGEIVLLSAAIPLLPIMLSNVFPRHLVYWVPLAALWSARLFYIVYEWKHWAGTVLVSLALALNIASDVKAISSMRNNTIDRYNLLPARWLKTKALPDETGYSPDSHHGFYGGLSRYSFGPRLDLEAFLNGDSDWDFLVASPQSDRVNDKIRQMLSSDSTKLGDLWMRGRIRVNGKEVFFYQRPPGNNPISDRQLVSFLNLQIPIILYLDRREQGGTIWTLNEEKYFEQNPDYSEYRQRLETNIPEFGKLNNPKDLFFALREQNRLESKKTNLLRTARDEFRKSITERARHQSCWIVISDPKITANAITSIVNWQFTPSEDKFEVYPPMDYGRLLWVDGNGEDIGWVNLARLVLSTPEGKELRDKIRQSLYEKGVTLENYADQLQALIDMQQEPTPTEIEKWNTTRLNMLALSDELNTELTPYRTRFDQIAISVMEKIREYGKKHNYALIYGVGRFSAFYDPNMPDRRITAQMLGID